MSDNDTAHDLRAPLPGGDQAAVLTWRAPRSGLRPGDQDVSRSEATHALLRTTDLDGRGHERRMELAEADAYLAEARALAARAAEIDKGTSRRRTEGERVRAEVVADIDLSCPRCQVAREYRGERHVVTVGSPQHMARGDEFGLSRPQAVVYHDYACPRCGSVELFADGRLPHPLG